MFLLLFLKRLFSRPEFFIPVLLAVGAFWAATNPGFAASLNAFALSLWTPEAAPVILSSVASALLFLATGSFVYSLFGWRRKPVDPVAVEARRVEVERLAAAKRAAWEASRVQIWRGILEGFMDEDALSELNSILRLQDNEGFADAVDRQNSLVMVWLLRWAIGRSAAEDAGSSDAQAKIHRAVDRVLCVAAEQNAWLSITYVSGAKNVVRPVFLGQAKQYERRCSGSTAFTGFAIWLAQS
ncbi:MAG: hypothetical protein AAB473_01705 [Patescibacteria group bacterium]